MSHWVPPSLFPPAGWVGNRTSPTRTSPSPCLAEKPEWGGTLKRVGLAEYPLGPQRLPGSRPFRVLSLNFRPFCKLTGVLPTHLSLSVPLIQGSSLSPATQEPQLTTSPHHAFCLLVLSLLILPVSPCGSLILLSHRGSTTNHPITKYVYKRRRMTIILLPSPLFWGFNGPG